MWDRAEGALKAALDGRPSTADVIRDREELAEQIRALGELIRILVDNALKYSPSDMPVTVTVRNAGGPVLAIIGRGLHPASGWDLAVIGDDLGLDIRLGRMGDSHTQSPP